MDVTSPWGWEHTLGQIVDQSGLSAMSTVSKHLKPMIDAGSVRLVSKPSVNAAMVPIGEKV